MKFKLKSILANFVPMLGALIFAFTVLGQTATMPSISTQPANVTVAPLTSATFSVGATGAAPLSYQWRKNGVVIQGWTNATLTLDGISTNDVGKYDVVVTNAGGTVTSNAATLALQDATATVSKTEIAADAISITLTPVNLFTIQCGKGTVTINCRTGEVTLPDPAVQTLPDTAIAFWKALTTAFPEAKRQIIASP